MGDIKPANEFAFRSEREISIMYYMQDFVLYIKECCT
jgi:hypothetical protein